jgi:hypothetical protein
MARITRTNALSFLEQGKEEARRAPIEDAISKLLSQEDVPSWIEVPRNPTVLDNGDGTFMVQAWVHLDFQDEK